MHTFKHQHGIDIIDTIDSGNHDVYGFLFFAQCILYFNRLNYSKHSTEWKTILTSEFFFAQNNMIFFFISPLAFCVRIFFFCYYYNIPLSLVFQLLSTFDFTQKKKYNIFLVLEYKVYSLATGTTCTNSKVDDINRWNVYLSGFDFLFAVQVYFIFLLSHFDVGLCAVCNCASQKIPNKFVDWQTESSKMWIVE